MYLRMSVCPKKKEGKTLPAARKQISNEAGHLFYFVDALGGMRKKERKTSRKSNVAPLGPFCPPPHTPILCHLLLAVFALSSSQAKQKHQHTHTYTHWS